MEITIPNVVRFYTFLNDNMDYRGRIDLCFKHAVIRVMEQDQFIWVDLEEYSYECHDCKEGNK